MKCVQFVFMGENRCVSWRMSQFVKL